MGHHYKNMRSITSLFIFATYTNAFLLNQASRTKAYVPSRYDADPRFKIIPGVTCGNVSSIPKPSPNFALRVVGTETYSAAKGQFPWQAALVPCTKMTSCAYEIQVCGASIISDYWLISAAHCTQGM